MGALCRAVAVRVAEMKLRKPLEANIESISDGDEAVTDVRTGEGIDGRVDIASCAIPPQLPILLDEAALEDILGVMIVKLTFVSWSFHGYLTFISLTASNL